MKRSNLLKNTGMKLKDFEDYLNTFMAMEELHVFVLRTVSGAKKPADMICNFKHPNPLGEKLEKLKGEDKEQDMIIKDVIRKHFKEVRESEKAEKAKKVKKDKKSKKK